MEGRGCWGNQVFHCGWGESRMEEEAAEGEDRGQAGASTAPGSPEGRRLPGPARSLAANSRDRPSCRRGKGHVETPRVGRHQIGGAQVTAHGLASRRFQRTPPPNCLYSTLETQPGSVGPGDPSVRLSVPTHASLLLISPGASPRGKQHPTPLPDTGPSPR